MDSLKNVVRVGVGVIVRNKNRVLLGKRKSEHGKGSWGFPGGHLEFNETLERCARLETKEETGIGLKNVRFAALTNDVFKETARHYITVFMMADYASGTVITKESNKCEHWKWFAWNKLPKPLFLPIKNLLKQQFSPFKSS